MTLSFSGRVRQILDSHAQEFRAGHLSKVEKQLLDLFEREIIGELVDLDKYEEHDGQGGVLVHFDSNEGDIVTGEKLAHFANFVADKTVNEFKVEQKRKVRS